MQTIRCAACGRRYDYRQEGCCPRCGAYNRPPRREWVAADGSVHHGAPSEKVCYEKKARFDGNGWASTDPYTTGRDVHRPGSAPVRYAMRKRYASRNRPASPERKRLHPLLRAVSGW